MYALWCYLIYGFIPKWEIINQQKSYLNETDERPVAIIYTLKCEKTGRITRKEIIG